MLDVRNAITNILDRYTLADVVEITVRKLRKNKMPLPFALEPLLEKPALRTKAVRRVKKPNGQTPVGL
jgi:hypothetical protein